MTVFEQQMYFIYFYRVNTAILSIIIYKINIYICVFLAKSCKGSLEMAAEKKRERESVRGRETESPETTPFPWKYKNKNAQCTHYQRVVFAWNILQDNRSKQNSTKTGQMSFALAHIKMRTHSHSYSLLTFSPFNSTFWNNLQEGNNIKIYDCYAFTFIWRKKEDMVRYGKNNNSNNGFT